MGFLSFLKLGSDDTFSESPSLTTPPSSFLYLVVWLFYWLVFLFIALEQISKMYGEGFVSIISKFPSI